MDRSTASAAERDDPGARGGIRAPVLPPLPADVEITPWPDNPAGDPPRFLVRSGGHRLLVDGDVHALLEALRPGADSVEELRRRCSAMGGRRPSPAEIERLLGDGPLRALLLGEPTSGGGPVALRRTLIPAGAAGRLGALLSPLYSPPVVIAALVAAAALLPRLAGRGPAGALPPGGALVLLGLAVASLLLHELGHVAACVRFGCTPGAIGAGLYLCFPVLFADVSDSWRLPRRQRLVVDVGGIYFQLLVVVAAELAGGGGAVAGWLVSLNLIGMIHMLNPILKLDGYWLLSDLSGIPNLHRRAAERVVAVLGLGAGTGPGRAALRPAQRRLLAVYLAVAVAYLLFAATVLGAAAARSLAEAPRLAVRAVALGGEIARGFPQGSAGAALQLAWLALQPLLAWAGVLWLVLRVRRWLALGASRPLRGRQRRWEHPRGPHTSPAPRAAVPRPPRLPGRWWRPRLHALRETVAVALEWSARLRSRHAADPLPDGMRAPPAALRASLGVDLAEATRIAAEADRAARRLLAVSRHLGRTPAWWVLERRARRVDTRALELAGEGSVVLALPLHQASLGVLARARAAGWRLVVLETVPSALLLERLADGERVRLCAGSAMLRHAAERRPGDPATAYVTFPDHQLGSAGARWRTRFLDADHLFTILEALLLARGVEALLALDRGGEGAPGRLALRRYPVEVAPEQVTPAEIAAVVTALAAATERAVRAAPAGLLCWAHLARNRVSAEREREMRQLASVREVLRAWWMSEGGLDEVHLRLHLLRLREAERVVRTLSRALN